jgi:hypothetical protein
MKNRLSFLSKLGALGGLFALMALAAFGASANSAAAAGPVASVSVAASAAGCGGQFTVVATVRDVQGLAPVPPVGVSITSSAGTIIGTTGITNAAGQVTATFMASNAFTGTGVVTASANGVTGTGPVVVNCGVVNPIYPVNPYPIYPINNYPCGYVGCIPQYNYNNCGTVPYSPIYGQIYRPPCNTYPLGYNNIGYCGSAIYTYASPCNGPFVGGAPARVNLAVSPAIATCGSTPVTVSANITDAFGVAVANGTPVSFSSTMGAIGGATTIGGNATATLTIPTGSAAGVAQIRVTAGGASATSTVQVNCAPVVQQVVVQQVVAQRPSQGQIIYTQAPRGPQQQPVIIQRGPAPAYVPPFAPPRTGEAGLTEAILAPNDDTAANQSLVSAWREAEYGVLDASQYDWVVIGDDTAAGAQLATDLIDEAYSVIDASQVDVIVVADDSAATTSMVVDVLSNPTDYSN